MKTIRKAELKEIFQAWAYSERKRFCYPDTLHDFDLLMQHQKNRCFIYGDLLSAQPLNSYVVSLDTKDIKNCKFLKQVDDKGKEEETSDIKKYSKKYVFNKSPNLDVWNFIAVARPKSNKLVIIDGLHRVSDWLREDHNLMLKTFKGYLIETKEVMEDFE